MSFARLAAIAIVLFATALPTEAQVRCGAFNSFAEPPAPRTEPEAVATFHRINAKLLRVCAGC